MNDELLTALEYIDPATLSYTEWLAVGMDLYANGYDVETWNEWSQSDSRYKNRECYIKWRSFGSDVTGGTIIGMAVKKGFQPSRTEPQHRRPRRIDPVELIEDYTENAFKWNITAEVTAAHEQLLNCTEKTVKVMHDGKAYIITPLTYLTRVRKIPLDIIKRYKIGYAPGGQNEILARYSEYQRPAKSKTAQYHKIIFPFDNGTGNYNYFMSETTDRTIQTYKGKDKNGNAIYGDIAKYLKPKTDNATPETPATVPEVKAELYNEYLLKGSDVPPIIYICEGIYDALSISAVGGSAIALTGTGNKRLLSICKTYKPNTLFVIALDNDGAGNNTIDRITQNFNALGVRYVIRQAPQPYKDFNECLQHDAELLRRYVTETAATTDGDRIAERIITAWNKPKTDTRAIDEYNRRAKNARKRHKNAF